MSKSVFFFLFCLALAAWAVSVAAQMTISADGVVESTSGGFKFPDGSVQTSAANAGEPVQASTNCIVPDDGNVSPRTEIFTVPTGKRLEVQFVNFGAVNLSSTEGLLPGLWAGGELFLFEELVGGSSFPGTGVRDLRSATHGVLMHVDSGQSLECEVFTTQSLGEDRLVLVKVAGHLVDVAP